MAFYTELEKRAARTLNPINTSRFYNSSPEELSTKIPIQPAGCEEKSVLESTTDNASFAMNLKFSELQAELCHRQQSFDFIDIISWQLIYYGQQLQY